MTTVDLDRVAAVLAEVAEAEILPRWRNLGTGDIREKTGPNDLVTVADEAAERAIGARLPDFLPGVNRQDLAGVIYEKQGGYADPVESTRAYVQAFVRAGGELRKQTPARSLIASGKRFWSWMNAVNNRPATFYLKHKERREKAKKH